jgi:hypothetical protein
MMFRHYAKQLPPARTIRYISVPDVNDLPAFMVVHGGSANAAQPREFGQGTMRYELLATVPHYGPSGFTWTIYQRREDR